MRATYEWSSAGRQRDVEYVRDALLGRVVVDAAVGAGAVVAVVDVVVVVGCGQTRGERGRRRAHVEQAHVNVLLTFCLPVH